MFIFLSISVPFKFVNYYNGIFFFFFTVTIIIYKSVNYYKTITRYLFIWTFTRWFTNAIYFTYLIRIIFALYFNCIRAFNQLNFTYTVYRPRCIDLLEAGQIKKLKLHSVFFFPPIMVLKYLMLRLQIQSCYCTINNSKCIQQIYILFQICSKCT